MSNNKNTWFLVVMAAQLVFSACDQKNGPRLGQDLLRSNSPRYETVTEAPTKQPASSATGASTPSTDTTGAVSDVPPLGGPPPFAPWGGPYEGPPVPTDDDIVDEDDLVGEHLGVPFGVCGNGIREAFEQCDDKNLDNLDGCNILCQLPFCGNGVVELGELCDDNNNIDGDGCNMVCEFERCGNFEVDSPTEECDDGNNTDGDGCSSRCLFERCGNGITDAVVKINDIVLLMEQCDDGNMINGDGCSDCCLLEVCGNGVGTPNEQCDDGNNVSGDGCSSTCKIEVPLPCP